MKRFSYFAVLCLLLLTGAAKADVMVLVHGYLGGADSWRSAGVAQRLNQLGWQDAGVISVQGMQVLGTHQPTADTKKLFYTVHLPSEAPILAQADTFAVALSALKQRHADQNVIVVGHSAGGLVARAAMVRQQAAVDTLITIASPNLGTPLAETGIDAADNPFLRMWSWMPFFGDNALLETLDRGYALYHDLLPDYPGSLVFWLNRQAHPQARYVSVVRLGPAGPGDSIVPAQSQDLSLVPGLAGIAERVYSHGAHGMQPMDADTIVWILNQKG